MAGSFQRLNLETSLSFIGRHSRSTDENARGMIRNKYSTVVLYYSLQALHPYDDQE